MYLLDEAHEICRKAALSMNQRTAVIVDPQPLWLEAAQLVLNRMEISVVGKTTSTGVARSIILDTRPDIVITELFGQPPHGISWLDEVRKRHLELRVIVLSMRDDPEEIETALAAGAVAYVTKTVHPDDLAWAIRQAFEHSAYLAARPASPRRPGLNTNGSALDATSLTSRQLEILRLVSEGHSNAEIARMLWVTEQTVKFHLSNIYRKLEVANRTEASRWAQVSGVLGPTASKNRAYSGL
jgi:DNA-binding NarL/FixJ family response regulator